MLRRKHPKFIRNVSQKSPVAGVRLSQEAVECLHAVRDLMEKAWNPADQPTISMIMDRAFVKWAQSIQFDPKRLEQARIEFLELSTPKARPEPTPTKKA